MRTLCIRIPDELDERLGRESRRVHRRRSEMVREAVGRLPGGAAARAVHGAYDPRRGRAEG